MPEKNECLLQSWKLHVKLKANIEFWGVGMMFAKSITSQTKLQKFMHNYNPFFFNVNSVSSMKVRRPLNIYMYLDVSKLFFQ